MSKRKGSKKKKSKNFIQASTQLSHPEQQNNASSQKKINIWKTISIWLGIVVGILTIILAVPQLRSMFLTERQKHEEENFVEGDLKPQKLIYDTVPYRISETPPIFTYARSDTFPEIKGLLLQSESTKNSGIYLMIGRTLFMIAKETYHKGIEFNIPFPDSACGHSTIKFAIKNQRLYISTEFKDLQNEETIGFIEFNHWKLYKPNLLYFKNDDNRLEVRDKQNNIVFSIDNRVKHDIYDIENKIVHNYTDNISLAGYFINPVSVIVIPNDTTVTKENHLCFPKTDLNWKTKSLLEIENIKSRF